MNKCMEMLKVEDLLEECGSRYEITGDQQRRHVVVVCLLRPMEGTLLLLMGRLQFSDLFTELPVPPQVAGVVGTF